MSAKKTVISVTYNDAGGPIELGSKDQIKYFDWGIEILWDMEKIGVNRIDRIPWSKIDKITESSNG